MDDVCGEETAAAAGAWDDTTGCVHVIKGKGVYFSQQHS